MAGEVPFNPMPDQLANFQQGGTGQALGPQPPLASAPGTTPSTVDQNSIPAPGAAPGVGTAATGPALQPGAAVDLQHHSAIGKLVKSIMGNDSQFVTQPDGSVQEVPVQQKPGQLFRGMLLAGILGAGTEAHGFGAGFAKGISGAAERGIQGRDRARAQEVQNQQLRQQQAKLNMEQTKSEDEHKRNQAVVEGDKLHNIAVMYSLNHIPQENIDRMNASSDATQRELLSAGGTSPAIVVNGKDINGTSGNALDWEKAIMDNPKLAFSQDDSHVRSVVTSYNVPAGAKVKDGEWVGSDGKPIDMHQFATIRVYDVPIPTLKQVRSMSGDEANKFVGSKMFDPDSKLSISLVDLFKMKGDVAKDSLEAAKVNAETAKAKKEEAEANKAGILIQKQIEETGRNDLKVLYDGQKTALASLEKDIEEENKSAQPDDNKISALRAQESAIRQQMVQMANSLSPKIGAASKTALPKPPKPNTPIDRATAQSYINAYGGDQQAALAAAKKDGWAPAIPQSVTTKPDQTQQQPVPITQAGTEASSPEQQRQSNFGLK